MAIRRNDEIGSLQDYWNQNRVDHYSLRAENKAKTAELAKKRRRRGLPLLLSLLLGFGAIALCLSAVICTLGYLTYSDDEVRAEVLGEPGSVTVPDYIGRLFGCGIDSLYLGYYSADEQIFIEAGRLAVRIDESSFLRDGSREDVYLASDMSGFVPDTIGTTGAVLVCGGRAIDVFITVRDTCAPTAQAVPNAVYWCGDELVPAAYVKDIRDATSLSIAFARPPECSEPCQTQFGIIITDEGGNFITVDCPVTVRKDITPPVITGAEDRTVYIGSSVTYKQGVCAVDDRDGEVEIDVDISDVVADTPGDYDVIYTAVDSSGNESSVTVTFTFTKSQAALIDEELDRLVESILSRIIREDMTTVEKAEAIYKWIRANITYISWVDKSNWKKAAIAGIKTGSGSCYTYYAVSRAMLDAVNIPNMMVQKIQKPGRSDHYWNLINCGTGWYHFDTTPRRQNAYFFMWTDAQILDYSRRHYNSHDFDSSLYPATPES